MDVCEFLYYLLEEDMLKTKYKSKDLYHKYIICQDDMTQVLTKPMFYELLEEVDGVTKRQTAQGGAVYWMDEEKILEYVEAEERAKRARWGFQ
jgi:hypothetical protein